MLTDCEIPKNVKKSENNNSSSVTFAQNGRKNRNNNNTEDNSWQKEATCHNCGEKGHIRPHCPKNQNNTTNTTNTTVGTDSTSATNNTTNQESANSSQNSQENKTGKQHLTIGATNANQQSRFNFFNFFNHKSEAIGTMCANMNDDNELKNYILLDNQSTVDVFCNQNLLNNIRKSNSTMTIETNGGTLTTNMKGHLNGHGEVWCHPDAITNILSLKNIKNECRVTCDSAKNSGFIVHKPDCQVIFTEHPSGLFHHDTSKR